MPTHPGKKRSAAGMKRNKAAKGAQKGKRTMHTARTNGRIQTNKIPRRKRTRARVTMRRVK